MAVMPVFLVQLCDRNISWKFHTTFLRFYRPGRADFTTFSLSFGDLLVDFFMITQKYLQSIVSEPSLPPPPSVFAALSTLAAN